MASKFFLDCSSPTPLSDYMDFLCAERANLDLGELLDLTKVRLNCELAKLSLLNSPDALYRLPTSLMACVVFIATAGAEFANREELTGGESLGAGLLDDLWVGCRMIHKHQYIRTTSVKAQKALTADLDQWTRLDLLCGRITIPWEMGRSATKMLRRVIQLPGIPESYQGANSPGPVFHAWRSHIRGLAYEARIATFPWRSIMWISK